jgi:hypothetical protein
VQTPLKHDSPARQVIPQPPQFASSLPTSMHRPSHAACRGPHWQTPELHEAPIGQRTPQPPQFCESKLVPTQTPPHSVEPATHPQVPAVQV